MCTDTSAYLYVINITWPHVQTVTDVHADFILRIFTSLIQSEDLLASSNIHTWTVSSELRYFHPLWSHAVVQGPLGEDHARRAAEVSVCSLLQPFSTHHVSQMHCRKSHRSSGSTLNNMENNTTNTEYLSEDLVKTVVIKTLYINVNIYIGLYIIRIFNNWYFFNSWSYKAV